VLKGRGTWGEATCVQYGGGCNPAAQAPTHQLCDRGHGKCTPSLRALLARLRRCTGHNRQRNPSTSTSEQSDEIQGTSPTQLGQHTDLPRNPHRPPEQWRLPRLWLQPPLGKGGIKGASRGERGKWASGQVGHGTRHSPSTRTLSCAAQGYPVLLRSLWNGTYA
jgi:hypothetical protein